VGQAQALTDLERSVLGLERNPYRDAGSKEKAIRERLGLPPTRYYQVLNGLLDHPGALAREPVLINRLRRMRESRRARR
jgi:hypothetical protein